jgi:mRNA interferase MazF
LPTHYIIKARNGLERDSIVLLEQLQTVDKARLKKYIGTLDKETMNAIDAALSVSVGLKKNKRG